MKLHLTLLFLLMLTLSACGDNSTEATSTGTLNGNAYLFDETGKGISERSGITVSLKERAISTTTKASGTWQLKDVPIGTYTILFSKPGFDTAKIFGFQFNGYGEVWVDEMTELLKPAPGRITQISITQKNSLDSGNRIVVKSTPSQEAIMTESSFSYVLNVSKTINFNWITNENNHLQQFTQYGDGNSVENSIYIDFLKDKFGSGTTVYLSGRLMHRRYGARRDNFNNIYYTGLSQPSETISFVIP